MYCNDYILRILNINKAEKIITGSFFSKTDIEQKFQVDPEKIKVIPSGVSSIFNNHNDKEGAQKELNEARGTLAVYEEVSANSGKIQAQL